MEGLGLNVGVGLAGAAAPIVDGVLLDERIGAIGRAAEIHIALGGIQVEIAIISNCLSEELESCEENRPRPGHRHL